MNCRRLCGLVAITSDRGALENDLRTGTHIDETVGAERAAPRERGKSASAAPPTDFHTATLTKNQILLVGCLGYPEDRTPRFTPVYALDLGGKTGHNGAADARDIHPTAA
jgi:hypothetical protein